MGIAEEIPGRILQCLLNPRSSSGSSRLIMIIFRRMSSENDDENGAASTLFGTVHAKTRKTAADNIDSRTWQWPIYDDDDDDDVLLL